MPTRGVGECVPVLGSPGPDLISLSLCYIIQLAKATAHFNVHSSLYFQKIKVRYEILKAHLKNLVMNAQRISLKTLK